MPTGAFCYYVFFISGPAVADRLIQEKKERVISLEKKYLSKLREKDSEVSTLYLSQIPSYQQYISAAT